ncbi:M20/M25/M40 family metallo-hydrolase [candidate division KSB1 bacterium]|nr:M20/M25/M40 family metallo-hydrolase [candidate division KSB1 bacterium]
MYNLLRQRASYLKYPAIDFTRELVRTPSQSLKEKLVAKKIAQKMYELGYDQVIEDDYGNVVGIIFGLESEPCILLNSHMDTVPAVKPSSDWYLPPYEGVVWDDNLYGLGAVDCKSGIAAQLYAGHLLKKLLVPLRGHLIVAVTVAEENGLSVGINYLCAKTLPSLGMKPSYAILGEPTNLCLYYGHDGWISLDIDYNTPDIKYARRITQSLVKKIALNTRSDNYLPELEVVSTNKSIDTFDKSHQHARVQLVKRLYAGDNADSIIDKIQGYALDTEKNYNGTRIDVKVHEEKQQLYNGKNISVSYIINAWETDPFSSLIDRSRQAITTAGCKVKPGKWQLTHLGMGTGGSILTQKYHIPTIGYGPGDEKQAHECNECVAVDNIVAAILGTAVIVQGLIGVPVFGWTSDIDI